MHDSFTTEQKKKIITFINLALTFNKTHNIFSRKSYNEVYEKEIQFQIMLKGFTDVGTPLGDTIESSIKGYIDKEY